MCYIGRCKNCCRIIRIYVADELRIHLECAVLLCPVLKCKIHCTRTKVTTTDTDLYNRFELLTGCICDLAIVYLICKLCNTVLLLYVKCSLIHAICLDWLAKLTTCHLMKNQTVLSCIDNGTIVKLLELVNKFSFLGKGCKLLQNCVIHFLCSEVVSKLLCHRYTVVLRTVCTALTSHNSCEVYTALTSFECLVRIQSIKIFPICHFSFLRNLFGVGRQLVLL